MRIVHHPAAFGWEDLIQRPVADLDEIRSAVRPILDDVRRDGDAALKAYSARFDGAAIDTFRVTPDEIARAEEQVSAELKQAVERALGNIRTFHQSQAVDAFAVETTEGITCWRKSVPIDSVGLYIPGGTAPLFSSVLMLAAPAVIAGCARIILCSPPDTNGKIHPAVLYAAHCCGVHEVYRVGGAQAIAAMAFGTESVAPVDKIFGPGNQYVTAAKQLVQEQGIAIDLPAGPSEVAVIADINANAASVAADLLAQAEHGPDSQVVLLTDDKGLADQVAMEVAQQLEQLPRRELAAQSIQNSLAVVFNDLRTALEFSNYYAPEHLIINTANYRELAEMVRNAGSVFLGPWTPESLGDYASGTNHTLPTNRTARVYSGVSLDSFVKKITFQEASRQGLHNIADSVAILAETEQLEGHKRAVTIRLDQ